MKRLEENKHNRKKSWETLNYLMRKRKITGINDIMRRHFGEQDYKDLRDTFK